MKKSVFAFMIAFNRIFTSAAFGFLIAFAPKKIAFFLLTSKRVYIHGSVLDCRSVHRSDRPFAWPTRIGGAYSLVDG